MVEIVVKQLQFAKEILLVLCAIHNFTEKSLHFVRVSNQLAFLSLSDWSRNFVEKIEK